MLSLLPSPADAPPAAAAAGKGEESLPASDTGPLAVYVWKTTADPFVGKLTYLRVYSSALHSDSRLWDQTKSSEERVGTLHVMRGKEQIAVPASTRATSASWPS